MKYEVIESVRWKHLWTGQTASIYGAVPWGMGGDKSLWKMEQVGYTVRDLRRNTVGIGRAPWPTREAAQAWIDSLQER